MYPFLRMAKEIIVHRNDPPLKFGETHVSRHMCWPWDLDFWFELNNGRTLTLYDLGRIPLVSRMGLLKTARENKWGMTVAGTAVRYRRRIRIFQTFKIRSRALGWDKRFFYVEQSIWIKGECANQAMYRMAITGTKGIVPPAMVSAETTFPEQSPELPIWVQNWIKAEDSRPWPPENHNDM
ncbi:acyl-CoA thioesterase [Profundibacter sp.]